MNNIKPIEVIIVDDHQIIVDGLRSLLAERKELKIVAGACSAQEALEILRIKEVDVAVVDIHMPVMTGIDLTKLILENHPDVRVLALSMHDDSSLINKMIEAGASGYVLKSSSMSEITEAILTVAAGKKFLSSEVQSIIMQNIFFHDDAISKVEPNVVRLSRREAEILELVAREFTNEQIADKLFISPRTVESHRKNIFTKTGTKTIVGLMKYALKHNLIRE
jgi:DNA-binding NarL/FixJ family response regulator